jgi:hypothetical protein
MMKLSYFLYLVSILLLGITSIVDGAITRCPAIGDDPKQVGKLS